jgi:hypothetical protein
LIQVSMEDSASAITSSGNHACGQHSRQPHAAGAFRQVVGSAGALQGAEMGRRRIRARTNRYSAAPRKCWRTIAGCCVVKKIVPEELAKISESRQKAAPKSKASQACRQTFEVKNGCGFGGYLSALHQNLKISHLIG